MHFAKQEKSHNLDFANVMKKARLQRPKSCIIQVDTDWEEKVQADGQIDPAGEQRENSSQ